jgi:mannose-1-phosphate guanylyltransferase / mannose-6-phosphate isomerase
MKHSVVPVVLCGGSGTRLWPLSSADRPKQLLPLVGEHTMLQDTLLRLRSLELDVAAPLIVCNERYGPLVAAQADALGDAVGNVILEPVGRNSAPAATVAALVALELAGGKSDPLLLVLPADHVIGLPGAFAAAVAAAAEPARAGYLTTFGVVPTEPATGYGYIRRGSDHAGWSEVAEFVEKPNSATARAYVDSGRYLWNSGMFLFGARAWLDELSAHAPQMRAVCEDAVASAARTDGFVRLGEPFAACPANSIDYAVMEKTSHAAVVPLSAGWSDVGSWSSLHDVLAKDASGNVASGDVVLESCRDTYVSSSHRLVAAIGLDGVVVVETEEAVLVVARDHAERVKRVAELVGTRAGSREKK